VVGRRATGTLEAWQSGQAGGGGGGALGTAAQHRDTVATARAERGRDRVTDPPAAAADESQWRHRQCAHRCRRCHPSQGQQDSAVGCERLQRRPVAVCRPAPVIIALRPGGATGRPPTRAAGVAGWLHTMP
jgi:hypothetical protein